MIGVHFEAHDPNPNLNPNPKPNPEFADPEFPNRIHIKLGKLNDGTQFISKDLFRGEVRCLQRRYYHMCNCIIFVVDSSDRKRIPHPVLPNDENQGRRILTPTFILGSNLALIPTLIVSSEQA